MFQMRLMKIRYAFLLMLLMSWAPVKLMADVGQYVILNAEYGTERNHVDVTNRLKELARSDRQFRMTNGTFGIDPDRGVVKTLRIYARGPDGRERMFEYVEGSIIDGAQFRSWGGGDWWRRLERQLEWWRRRRGRVPDSERAIWHAAQPRRRDSTTQRTGASERNLSHGQPNLWHRSRSWSGEDAADLCTRSEWARAHV
jgi:hypothetical protein